MIQRLRQLRLDFLLALCIAAISIAQFSALVRSRTFGPEFSLFFVFTHGRSFSYVIQQYLSFHFVWYRPTQFILPYWIGDHFLSWHNLAGWRYFELATVFTVCILIYVLALQLRPGRRMAALFAALYFTWVPMIHIPLHDLFAFDFLHIIFTLLCVVTFIEGYRTPGAKGLTLTGASWLSCVIALTSKEIAIVIPVFLLLASILLLAYEPPAMERRKALLREACRLAPFSALLPVYWLVHLRKVSSQFASSGEYRIGANWEVIFENLRKYPLWFAHLYGLTPDREGQAVGYVNMRNEVVGFALVVLIVAAWIYLWRADVKSGRRAENRKCALFALAWIGVFLTVPVYSGGRFWHGNLALCGYCLLFGAAVEWVLDLLPSHLARWICATLLILGAITLTRADAAHGLASGFFAKAYRVNSTVLTAPPLPLGRVSGKALVYVEDGQGLGNWYFGAGDLFNLVYLDRDLQQVTVPRKEWIEPAELSRWLRHPNAFYFRYDNKYEWRDATEEFRRYASENANKPTPVPEITDFGPKQTRAGVGFNVQPDGTSAVGFVGHNFRPGSVVLINGAKAATSFGTSEFVSVTVPSNVYSHPGNVTFQVQSLDGSISPVVTFRVTP